MVMFLPAAALVLLLGGRALAHGGVWKYTIEGKDYNGYKWWVEEPDQVTIQRRWPARDPLEHPTDVWMACNKDGTPTSPSLHAPVTAGSIIEAHYEKNFLIPGEFNSNDTWGHEWGPAMVYMADCKGSCDEFDASKAEPVWFKIFESGLLSGIAAEGEWATTRMAREGVPLTVKIPDALRSGNYMIRHELLALHTQPPQIYPECAQLKVISNGTEIPGEEYLVAFPGAYSENDPGFAFQLWTRDYNATTYEIPGPKVWPGR